ncbi:hypothetical protein LCGC14_0335480 [marine sediment metagenome]|uniref:STAS domain-containing protein n=1 Tax=marine sediment metagenome TaxID=412755 RepID=A0A0F9TKX6_9ZZZZ|nr:anti-sigma factor antagonist [Phycisphaerae bacterium]HDZ43754.1 anti-sigma factor antagonist [Phycisphaerae bacterium]
MTLQAGGSYNLDVQFYYHEVQKDVIVISADGGLNRQTSGQFTDDILRLIEGGMAKIIVDCEHLTYISSYGFTVLLQLHKRAKKAGGEVKIASVHTRVADAINMMHLNKVFQIYPDVNRALLHFRPKDSQD